MPLAFVVPPKKASGGGPAILGLTLLRATSGRVGLLLLQGRITFGLKIVVVDWYYLHLHQGLVCHWLLQQRPKLQLLAMGFLVVYV